MAKYKVTATCATWQGKNHKSGTIIETNDVIAITPLLKGGFVSAIIEETPNVEAPKVDEKPAKSKKAE